MENSTTGDAAGMGQRPTAQSEMPNMHLTWEHQEYEGSVRGVAMTIKEGLEYSASRHKESNLSSAHHWLLSAQYCSSVHLCDR